MKHYLINEIFYSLQGEGRWAGRPAVFIRFAGCNLKCPFCDTDFKASRKMLATEIIEEAMQYGCNFVVLTGGEPTMQVTDEFIDAMHDANFYIAMETNGTREVPSGVDWITCSPKAAYVENASVWLREADEVKVVFDGIADHTPDTFDIEAEEYYVQPCDTGNAQRNEVIVKQCVEWVKAHPNWKLSLQQQKILNVR